MKVLVVEDEKDLRTVLRRGLESKKYTVDEAKNGKIALEKLELNKYDLVLLDLNLPFVDGIDVCKNIRNDKIDTGIIMLTTRTEIEDRVEGLDVGADDYIGKPFSFKELLARIEAVMRSRERRGSNEINVDELKLDSMKKRVWLSGTEIKLNAKEFGILEYLMRNKGKVVNQGELFEHVWSEEADPFTKTVKAQINNLRRKIDKDRKEDSYIKTIKNQGYLIA